MKFLGWIIVLIFQDSSKRLYNVFKGICTSPAGHENSYRSIHLVTHQYLVISEFFLLWFVILVGMEYETLQFYFVFFLLINDSENFFHIFISHLDITSCSFFLFNCLSFSYWLGKLLRVQALCALYVVSVFFYSRDYIFTILKVFFD